VIGFIYTPAAQGPPSMGPTIVLEIVGVFFLYAATFGELRRIPSESSRIINVFVFLLAGMAFVVGAFVELHRMGADLTGIVVVIAVGIPLGAFDYLQRRRFSGSSSRPTTGGTVESADVREVRTRSTNYFVLDAAYSYSIRGEYYSGRFTKNFDSESEARDYANSIKNAGISLRYKPEDESISCFSGQ
jgi:hypothetical protein